MPKHLLVAISGHGFGHLTQVAPVINELYRRAPGLRVTVASSVSVSQLASRIQVPFTLLPEAHDFGMHMHNALEVKLEMSLTAYREFHAGWPQRVQQLAARLEALAPDVILADVPYLTLAAAHQAGIPAVALCSLNWADIFRHYFAALPDGAAIHADILAAYRQADLFLQPEPSMPMADLPNRRPIGPIAEYGQDRRGEIDARMQLDGSEKLVLLGLGGLQFDFQLHDWPQDPGIRYLVPARQRFKHPQAYPFDDLKMPFIDILRSVDVLVTKPGYGSFTDAACNRVPVLFVSRPDWPEAPYLTDWLVRQGRGLEIRQAQLATGDLAPSIADVLALPQPPALAPQGIFDAADILSRWLT
jgi:UDP:flavonoid glycosyltransferase YjiC (YdhE family)